MKNKTFCFTALLIIIAVLGANCVFAASSADEGTAESSGLNVHITSNFFDDYDIAVKDASSRLRVTFELWTTMDIEQLDFRMNYDSSVLAPAESGNSPSQACPNLKGLLMNTKCEPSAEYENTENMLSVAAAATNFRHLMDFSSEKKVLVTVLFDISDSAVGETTIDLVVRDLYFKATDSDITDESTCVVYLSTVDAELRDSIVISADASAEEIFAESTSAAETTTSQTSATEQTTAAATPDEIETTTAFSAEESTESTAAEPTETTAAAAVNFALGDVNRDGRIDISDATLVQKFIADLAMPDDEQLILADVTADSEINVADVTGIQKYIAQIIAALPISLN